jgi:hypothetical protein
MDNSGLKALVSGERPWFLWAIIEFEMKGVGV